MRLRRETGDFQITINSENAVNTIRKGLSAEDFVGELVNVNGTYEVVNSANDTETGAEFKTNSFTLTYTKATGVITAEEGGSGSGSGSGGGSNEFIIPVTSRPEGMTTVLETAMPFMMIRMAYEAGKDLALAVSDGYGNIVKTKLTYAFGTKLVQEAANIGIITGISHISISGTTGTISSISIAAENGDTSAPEIRLTNRIFSVSNPNPN